MPTGSRHIEISCEVTLILGKIDSFQSRIALQGTRHISCGGMTSITNSAEELAKLEAALVLTELARDLKVARPKRRNPEVIIFGVDPNLHESRIKCI